MGCRRSQQNAESVEQLEIDNLKITLTRCRLLTLWMQLVILLVDLLCTGQSRVFNIRCSC